MSKKRLSTSRKIWMVQRGIVLQLLRDDHDERWTRSELRAEISDFTRHVFNVSLELLEGNGCVVFDGKQGVRASACARHLDSIELIGV